MSESTATYGLVDVLAARGISRRSFLKFCGTLAVAAGLSSAAAPRVANALETELENAKGGLFPVLWIEGASCTGCTESFAQIETPDVGKVVLELIALNYSDVLCAGAGHSLERAKEETIQNGNYVVVYEGGITQGFGSNTLRVAMETGEEICRNKMAESEGYLMTFTDDSKYVLDLDHWGRTMLLDTENQFSILDEGFKDKDGQTLFSYLHYDRFGRNIYKIVDRGHGYKCAAAMVTSADKDHIDYKVIREFQGPAPDHLKGISFCREQNYYLTSDKKQIVVTDKDFQETGRIQMPFKDEEAYRYIQKVLISPGEKYVFISLGGTDSALFELSSMKLVREFEYGSLADFKMIEDDRRYIISTWNGTYIGEV